MRREKISEGTLLSLEKKVVSISREEVAEELAKLQRTPASDLVIDTGVKDYGLPADAKERRM